MTVTTQTETSEKWQPKGGLYGVPGCDVILITFKQRCILGCRRVTETFSQGANGKRLQSSAGIEISKTKLMDFFVLLFYSMVDISCGQILNCRRTG